jgi:hypothetical protein
MKQHAIESDRKEQKTNSFLNRVLIKILIFILAVIIWLPCLHVFYKPDIEEYYHQTGIPPKASMLAARHLKLWTDPVLREQELQKMQARNPEWDFMSRTYFVLSLANMAMRDPAYKPQALEIIDTILEHTLQLEREKGFHHFLLAYANIGSWRVDPPRSLFVDGEIALMLAARRFIEEKPEYIPLLSERISAIVDNMSLSPVLCSESYPHECWMFCNTVALAAVKLADVLDGANHSDFLGSWVETAKRQLTESQTGLLISTFDVNGKPSPVGFSAEGSTIWMACHMLEVVDQAFAQDQYQRARKELGRSFLGFGFSREWPESSVGSTDIDSGPIVPGFEASASASGLALIAAAAFHDTAYLSQLITSLNFAGFPVETDGALRYQASNPVGDAVMLYAMVQGPLWEEVQRRERL